MQPFGEQQFRNFSGLINDSFGIYFGPGKKELLRSKLQKILTRYGLESYDEYYNMLRNSRDKRYLAELAQEITVNKTDFFREKNHFEFISDQLSIILEKRRRLHQRSELRIWSAGCSTGQEPYSLAMVLRECLPKGTAARILATDVNNRVLSTAIAGIYPESVRGEIPPDYFGKHFEKTGNGYIISDDIKRMVTFREFNVKRPFPFKRDFDMVFCRNVMIYFDASTQQQLIDKLYDVITPGGLLFIGHSESLSGRKHRFSYIRPTIYMK